jgi:hypothetical protein
MNSSVKNRALTPSELEDIWISLAVIWDVDQHYWYPLRESLPRRDDCEAFYTPFFEIELGHEKVRQILISHSLLAVYELREGGTGEMVAVEDLEFYYSSLEGYWTFSDYSWLIYASHESSITFAGVWLLDEIKKAWPNWKNCVYRSPFAHDYVITT